MIWLCPWSICEDTTVLIWPCPFSTKPGHRSNYVQFYLFYSSILFITTSICWVKDRKSNSSTAVLLSSTWYSFPDYMKVLFSTVYAFVNLTQQTSDKSFESYNDLRGFFP